MKPSAGYVEIHSHFRAASQQPKTQKTDGATSELPQANIVAAILRRSRLRQRLSNYCAIVAGCCWPRTTSTEIIGNYIFDFASVVN